MKVEVLQENLSQVLGKIAKTIPSKAQIPILSHVLIVAQNGVLTLTGSDMQTTVVANCGAKIVSDGQYTVPMRTLLEIISSLPAEKITLNLSESGLEILCGKYHGKITGTAAEEYPKLIPSAEIQTSWSIAAAEISEIAMATTFSAGTDESRAVLTGILIKSSPDGLVCVATDGFRLSLLELKLKNSKSANVNVVIPARSISEIARLISDSASSKDSYEFSVLVSNQLKVVIGDIVMYTTLISGNFPNFEKIIPSEMSTKIVLSADDFQRAVKLSSVFARENANIVRLRFSPDNPNLIQLFSQGGQTGEDLCDVPAEIETKAASDMTVAFNFHYLLDFLSSLTKKGDISIELSGATSAAIFKSASSSNYLHVVMPVRVQS
jgi:DNA polymerase-3 subunit beta